MIENLHKKILTAILISILILALLTIYADLNKLVVSFKNFKWFFIIPVLILSLLNYLVRFFRWEFYLKKLGIKISTSKNFLIFLSGLTMSITPGKFGEALKSYLLKITDNVPLSRSAPIVVFERINDFIAFVILALYGSLYFNYGREIVVSVGFAVITGIFIFSKKEIVHFLIEKTRKVFGDRFTAKVNTAYNNAIELSDFRILVPMILISILSWFFECVGFYLVIYAYSIDVSLDLATFIYSFSTIAGAISMLPGGLGPTEGSMTALLVLNQVPKDIAVAITIIIRFATLWFAVVLGLIALYLLRKKIGKIENV